MNTKYFIIVNGEQVGPLEITELRNAGMTADSPVWREGLENWVKASTLPELYDVLYGANTASCAPPPHEPYNAQPQQSYNKPNYGYNNQQYNGYNQQNDFQQYNGYPIAHTNWLTWAIIATVLGAITSCIGLIFGIIGIINANKANDYYNNGNKQMGDSANSTARTMTIIALVLSGIGLISSVALLNSSYLDTIRELYYL